MPKSLKGMDLKLEETKAEIEALQDSLASNRAASLTGLITTGGKLKGELVGVTPKQYRELTGHEPSPSLLSKVEGGTTAKIPWHLILDQIATERGYKSDEELKTAIEKAAEDKERLEQLKSQYHGSVAEINVKRESKPEIDTVKISGEAPITKDTTTQEVTEVDGLTIKALRQPSYWQVKSSDSEAKVAIRHALDARKLIRAVAQKHVVKLSGEFKGHARAKVTRQRRGGGAIVAGLHSRTRPVRRRGGIYYR